MTALDRAEADSAVTVERYCDGMKKVPAASKLTARKSVSADCLEKAAVSKAQVEIEQDHCKRVTCGPRMRLFVVRRPDLLFPTIR